MIGLFDRDVFLKLCCCNLWFEAVEALGLTQAYRLQSTSSEKANKRKLVKMLGEHDSEAAIALSIKVVAEVPVLPDELVEGITSTAGFAILANVEDIDEGEQVLGAILLQGRDGKIMISGDKRFVRAIQREREDCWRQIADSVISFERCLIAIEKMYGFEHVLARAAPSKQCDATLRLAIGHTPSRDTFLEALHSFDPCGDRDTAFNLSAPASARAELAGGKS